jgi:hypothetical protein
MENAIKRVKAGKITIKHYPNKKLKPQEQEGLKYYPLYVQVMAKGQTAFLKSLLHIVVSEEGFSKFLLEFERPLNQEVDRLKRIIASRINNDDFSLIGLSTLYEQDSNSLTNFIDSKLKWLIIKDLSENNSESICYFLDIIKISAVKLLQVIESSKPLHHIYIDLKKEFPSDIWNLLELERNLLRGGKGMLHFNMSDLLSGYFAEQWVEFYGNTHKNVLPDIEKLLAYPIDDEFQVEFLKRQAIFKNS